MKTIYFVGNPVLDIGKKFYPVRKAYKLSEEEAAGKIPACVAIAEASHVIEYFESKRSAESYVDAMVAQTEGLQGERRTTDKSFQTHDCRVKDYHKLKHTAYGWACDPVVYYDKDLAHWYVSNGEYATEVFFCPWCGEKMPTEGL